MYQYFSFEAPGEDAAVPAVHNLAEAMTHHAVDHGGELRGLRQHWDEARSQPVVDVDAKEAGWVKLAETAEELAVGDVVEPALAHDGCTDKGRGKADTDDDLPEKVVIVENLGYRGCRRCWGMRL
jgi:hypothetical protein